MVFRLVPKRRELALRNSDLFTSGACVRTDWLLRRAGTMFLEWASYKNAALVYDWVVVFVSLSLSLFLAVVALALAAALALVVVAVVVVFLVCAVCATKTQTATTLSVRTAESNEQFAVPL